MENDLKIPEGYQRIMPYLILEEAENFLNFVQTVFDAREKMLVKQADNPEKVMHGEVMIGDSTIMFANSGDNWGAQTAGMFIYVRNADETYAKALAAGATSIQEPGDQEYGRASGVRDPFGNTWWITSVLEA